MSLAMKKLLILLTFVLLVSGVVPQVRTQSANNKPTIVWICTGKYATTYHAHKNCKGLNNCKGTIKATTLQKALDMKRRACKSCYK